MHREMIELRSKGFAKVTDTTSRFVNRTHTSTLAEYHGNGAAEHIDNGRIPYLVNLDLDEMVMHAYIELADLVIKPGADGQIGVVLSGGQGWLPGDTLIVWR